MLLKPLLFALLAGMFQSSVVTLDQETLKSYLEIKAPFDFILIDVRGADEITTAIGNAACKPYNLAWPEQFKDAVSKIPKDFPVIIYCRSGGRATRAAEYLNAAGYTKVYNAGGISTWTGPTVPGSAVKPVSLLPEPSMRAAKN
jgi:phage shock protein E